MGRIKTGVLIPKSDMYPALGMDLLNGLKLAFAKNENFDPSPDFIIENIGVGADDQVLKSAEKLVLQENVGLTLAFCSVQKLKELAAMHSSYQRPLIHLDIGGRIYQNDHCNPYVLHHTLNIWQSAFAAGKYAAQKLGKRAVVAASFYDGAYHMTEAFSRGFASEGGEIVRYFVSPADYKSESFDGLLAMIEEEDPDFLFSVFSFKEGNKVMSVLADSKFNGQLPILTIPTMTDETIISEDYKLKNVKSVASWTFDDPTPAMQEFVSSYKATYEKVPNIIALLGFEVGLTIKECLLDEGKIRPDLKAAVEGRSIETPRGKLRYNSFNESQVETFKIRGFEYNETQYHNPLLETTDSSFVEELQATLQDVPYHGWQNPYLCT